jgi:hypothetical protein
MSRILSLSLFLIALMPALADDPAQCYRYDTDDLNTTIFIDYMQDGRPQKLKWFTIAFRHSEEYNSTYGDATAMADGYFFSVGIYCGKEKNATRYCGADCDHGNFLIDNKYNLRINRLGLDGTIGCENYYGDPENGFYIDTHESWLRAHPVPCNRYTKQKARTRPKPSDRKRYVCYTSKTQTTPPSYTGCFRSNSPCKAQGKRHFGHYPDFCAAAKAMYRCSHSSKEETQ